MSRPLLVHVHIPKVGGTSIVSALQWWFKEKHVNWHQNDRSHVWSIEDMEKKIMQEADMISLSSHFIRQFPKECGGRRLLYFCFIREPLDWYISHFSYCKKKYNEFPEEVRKTLPPNCSEISIRDAINYTLQQEEAAGRKGNWLNRFFAEPILQPRNQPAIGGLQRFESQCVEVSKAILDSFWFVGLTQKFEESFQALRTLICRQGHDLCELNAPVENQSADFRDDLSWLTQQDPLGSEVYKSFELDFQLYKHGQKLAEQHLRLASKPKEPYNHAAD